MHTTGIDRTTLARRLVGVEGWFHEDEAWELFAAAARRPGPLRMLEIGSWKGRSTIALATAVEASGTGGTVVAVDPHTGSVEHHDRWGTVDTFGEFLANLDRAGVRPWVQPLRMCSHEARAVVDGPFDVVFIDGSHEYRDVVQDIDDWAPLVKPGGVLALNDTSWPGVHDAVRQRLLGHRSPWRAGRLVRSTLFLDHRPDSAWAPADSVRLMALRAVLASRRLAGRYVDRMPDALKRAGNAVSGRLTGR